MSEFPSDIRQQVKYLSAYAKKASLILAGLYKSSFHGDGMIFSEFRDYVYGDDVRHISWNTTAKWGRPIVKIFEQERQTPVVLAIDKSGSLNYGTTKYNKSEVAAHLAALLGLCAEQNRDPVGLLLFSDHIEKYNPPKDQRGGFMRLIFDCLNYESSSKKTSIKKACEFLQKNLTKKSVIFLVSDFLDDEFDISLRALAAKHEVIGLKIEDPSEKDFKGSFLINYKDLETGKKHTLDSSSFSFKEDFKKQAFESSQKKVKLLEKSQVKVLCVETNSDYIRSLISFFKEHRK